MAARLVGELTALKVAPTVFELQSGSARHGIDLFWRRVAHTPRPKTNAARLGELDELSFCRLFCRAMSADGEDDSIDAEVAHGHVVDGQSVAGDRRLGNDPVDEETSSRLEPCGCIAHTSGLLTFVVEVEQRVEGDHDQRERSSGDVINHVTLDGFDAGARISGGQSFQHRCAGVDADHAEPSCSEGNGDPSGADTQLTDRPAFGELGEHGDQDGKIIEVAVPLVVDVGERRPIGVGSVSIHLVQPSETDRCDPPPNLHLVEHDLVYFDHAATTTPRSSAIAAMLPWLEVGFANPNGSHAAARTARRAVDEARDLIADTIGLTSGEVVFTSCGTESDNTAIAGTVAARGGVALCSAAEHHAVLDPVLHLNGVVVPVGTDGAVDADELGAQLRALREASREVTLVSIMAVNNEVGTITDMASIAAVVRREAPGAWLHTDAVQAACWLDLREITALVDMLSLSAHKFGGPKGVGVLTMRDGVRPDPLLRGGGQERGRRSGTTDVAGVVGTSVALAETDAERASTVARIAALKSELVDGILGAVDGAMETVARDRTVPGVAHLCFPGVENEALLFLLDREGVCASAASACASGAMEPSHVLASMGIDRSVASGALRLSLGHTTTSDDVARAVTVVAESVARLRQRTGTN